MNCKTCNFTLNEGQNVCPICGTPASEEVVNQSVPVESSVLKQVLPADEKVSIVEENPTDIFGFNQTIVEENPVIEEIVPVVEQPPVVDQVATDVFEFSQPTVIETPVVEQTPQDVFEFNQPIDVQTPVVELEKLETSVIPSPMPNPTPEFIQTPEVLPNVSEQTIVTKPMGFNETEIITLESSVLPDNNAQIADIKVNAAPVAMINSIDPNTPVANQVNVEAPKPVEKKSNKLVFIIIAIILIVGAAYAGYFIVGKNFSYQLAPYNNHKYKISANYDAKLSDNTLRVESKDKAWLMLIKTYTTYDTMAEVKTSKDIIKENTQDTDVVVTKNEIKTVSGVEMLVMETKSEGIMSYTIILPNNDGALLNTNISFKDGNLDATKLDILANIVKSSVKDNLK